MFNYYLEGLAWSFAQKPYIKGIYYDGINFDRQSMIRVRRAADAAAAAAGSGPASLDLHTGREGTPDTCSVRVMGARACACVRPRPSPA